MQCLVKGRDPLLALIFKVGTTTEQGRRRIRGLNHLAKVIAGVKLKDGAEVNQNETGSGNAA